MKTSLLILTDSENRLVHKGGKRQQTRKKIGIHNNDYTVTYFSNKKTGSSIF